MSSMYGQSNELFEKAKIFIPGGVNSPVRAFKAVGGNPIFMERGKGPWLFDVDGHKYIELINSWGPMLFGHAFSPVEKAVQKAIRNSFSFGTPTELEVDMARLITEMVPSVEMVRMVNSGTEATMSAIRVARGYTGKDKIIKFEGCYHGHGDAFLISAGSGAMTMGEPDSPGVTKGTAADTLLAPYNNLNAVENLVAANKDQIAALIIEPVAGNMGLVLPQEGFLEGLRKLCSEEKIVLIFDEVMTGFRLAAGGAQELLGVQPDLTTLGKIIGGGMPVGAYGGKREIMECVSPSGPVYQAGTLSGNPIAMAAGYAMLRHIEKHPNLYAKLDAKTEELTNGLCKISEAAGVPYSLNQIGSMYSLFFTANEVVDWASAKTADTVLFGRYFQAMLKRGIYLAPSQFESLFISTALKSSHISAILNAHKESLAEITC